MVTGYVPNQVGTNTNNCFPVMSAKVGDPIRPEYYCSDRKFEPKDVIRDWNLSFNLGSATKYIARNGKKENESAIKDLKKAIQYIQFEIDYLQENNK